jgi:hypothetical protein
MVGERYVWDIDRVFAMVEVEENGRKIKRPTVYGHCMSYAEIFVTGATALGYFARHMANLGFREASHEIVDAWVPSLGKWVYFDPSLSNYYYDKKTKEPLNLIEMHKIVADTFVPSGKDMHWFSEQHSEETQALVRKIGGQTPIGSRLGPWRYGKPMPRDYDWGWFHGYLAAGFVQMTPRNDFHSHPDAQSKYFQHYPGYSGYPNWVDAKTPPRKGGHNWYRRMRDFYWTLDQASLRLETIPDRKGTVRVELGQSMPFFKRFVVQTDDTEAAPSDACFDWDLHKGANALTVTPVDEFGRAGTGSSVTLRYRP